MVVAPEARMDLQDSFSAATMAGFFGHAFILKGGEGVQRKME